MRRSTAIFFSLLLFGAAAGADVLVTRDGGEIETRGPWKIKGRTVVFTLPNGTLSSVRLDEVDLDKSAVATARQQVPAPPPAPAETETAKKTPVMVITDRDVKKADAAGGASTGAAGALRVGEWKLEPLEGDPAFELVGAVTNGGETAVANVEITATLWAPDRSSSMAVLAQLDKPALKPGETSRFRVALSKQRVESSGFAAVFGQAKAEFSVQAEALPEENAEPGEEQRDEEAAEEASSESESGQ